MKTSWYFWRLFSWFPGWIPGRKDLASTSRAARCAIALPRRITLCIHTAPASEDCKDTEKWSKKKYFPRHELLAFWNLFSVQCVSPARSIISSLLNGSDSALFTKLTHQNRLKICLARYLGGHSRLIAKAVAVYGSAARGLCARWPNTGKN